MLFSTAAHPFSSAAAVTPSHSADSCDETGGDPGQLLSVEADCIYQALDCRPQQHPSLRTSAALLQIQLPGWRIQVSESAATSSTLYPTHGLIGISSLGLEQLRLAVKRERGAPGWRSPLRVCTDAASTALPRSAWAAAALLPTSSLIALHSGLQQQRKAASPGAVQQGTRTASVDATASSATTAAAAWQARLCCEGRRHTRRRRRTVSSRELARHVGCVSSSRGVFQAAVSVWGGRLDEPQVGLCVMECGVQRGKDKGLGDIHQSREVNTQADTVRLVQ